jgi:hypothetical protein
VRITCPFGQETSAFECPPNRAREQSSDKFE